MYFEAFGFVSFRLGRFWIWDSEFGIIFELRFWIWDSGFGIFYELRFWI